MINETLPTLFELVAKINQRPVSNIDLDAAEALVRLNKTLTVKTDLYQNPSLPEFVRFESAK